MKKITFIGGMAAFVLGIAATMAPVSALAQSSNASRQNIVQTAVSDPAGRFTTLAAALTCTDLVGLLQVQWLKFTVFAPTNEAFGKKNLNADNICSTLSKRELRNILLYHVNLGQKDAATVLNRRNLLMANLQWAPIQATPPSIASATIIQTDVRTSNGIIHVLDDVMMPVR